MFRINRLDRQGNYGMNENSGFVSYGAHQRRRMKRVAAITVISIVSSLLITYAILSFSGSEKLPIIFIIAFTAPLIIAPVTSWSIIGLMIKVQKLEEAHRQQATYDDLTGLLTRRAFLNQGEALLKFCLRNNQSFSLALLDLDNFKLINDLYGHGGGDEALKTFAKIMAAEMRASDLVGRLGGEEFAIVLPDSTVSDALTVLERVRKATEYSETKYLDAVISYTVSVGLAGVQDEPKISFATLIKQADDALYQAKAKGRNLIVMSEL